MNAGDLLKIINLFISLFIMDFYIILQIHTK